MGYTGLGGKTGATGWTGPQGVQGPRGNSGATGATGMLFNILVCRPKYLKFNQLDLACNIQDATAV